MILIFLSFDIVYAQSESTEINDSGIDKIKGIWTIDLKPTPDAESYLKEFSIENIDGKSFSGKFYETDFVNGQLNLDWGKIYFAFTTKDASNSYFHSGYFEGDNVFGISYSAERKFTLPWTGEKNNIYYRK
jgi:hypothetical protein